MLNTLEVREVMSEYIQCSVCNVCVFCSPLCLLCDSCREGQERSSIAGRIQRFVQVRLSAKGIPGTFLFNEPSLHLHETNISSKLLQ